MSDEETIEPVEIDWHTGVPLASGASGEVVRAFSPELGREIAVKYLRVEEPAAIERMLREAHTQAGLEHPNILPVHATGVHLDRHYIAMDVVDGRPLDRALVDADTDARLGVFDQVLDAMAHAHTRGVVHRDLKPANLMVEKREGELHAWVMDFGLARRPEDATLTVAGDALGTPGYMAPEQARGSEGADPRADVYALGVVLYQLLTGRLPYTADTPMALVVQAAAGQIVPVTEIRRRLPEGLARIIVRCLESEPARRYADAGALRADLGSFVAGRSVDAPALDRRFRLARWARSNPWRARLAVALGAVVLGAGLGLIVIGERGRQALNTASDLIAEAERARGDWYVDQLLPLHDQRPAERAALKTIERLEAARESLGGAAAPRIDAALADLLDAIGAEARAFERARSAWRGGVRDSTVANRAARARLQQFGARRLELSLTADPGSLDGLLEAERGSLAGDLAEFRAALGARLAAHVDREVAGQTSSVKFAADAAITSPSAWQGRLLELQPVAAAAIERLNVDGASALAELEPIEAALAGLILAVRSYKPAYRLGCQLETARQSLRTMQSGAPVDEVARSTCDRALMLDPEDADLLATSSMQLWQRAKDLRRNRKPYAEPLRQAIAQAEAALSVDPDHELAQISLGSAMQVRARRQMAEGEDPEPALDASLRWLERAHTTRPNDLEIMNNLAVTWNTLAAVRLGEGDPRAALEADRQSLAWLQRAAATAPDDRRLAQNMLLALTTMIYQASLLGDDPGPETEATVSALRALAEDHPDYISPLNTLGLAWWTQGVWDARVGNDPAPAMRAAQAAFEQALERRPDWESARINHASVARQWYAMAGERPGPELEAKVDDALSIYRQLEPADADKREFGCLIAEILAARAGWRQRGEALGLLREALALSDPASNIEWLHGDCRRVRARIGWTLLSLNDAEGPVDLLWRETVAASAGADDPDLLRHAARFAQVSGNTAQAREWRNRIPPVFRERIFD